MKERTLTRRDFLKVAGAGAAGATMLGAAGCGTLANSFTQVPDEYLPSGGSRMNVILVIIDSLRRDHLGVYGNDWIKTPNLDALARESLRFDRSYPESLPTILARRAIHTGIRTFPFRDWQKWYDEDVNLWGWQPIPRGQVTLAEILLGEGFYNLMVTDTLHQFRPFYDMHRGFHAFDFIRGQERDLFRPPSPASEKKMENTLIGGPSAAHSEEIMRQYWANTMGRQREEDWFAPQVFTKAAEYLEMAKESPALLHARGQLRPARAVGPAAEVHRPLQRRLRRPRASHLEQRSLRLADGAPARADARALLRRGDDDRPLARPLPGQGAGARASWTTPC